MDSLTSLVILSLTEVSVDKNMAGNHSVMLTELSRVYVFFLCELVRVHSIPVV